jgi:hypothetical protein
MRTMGIVTCALLAVVTASADSDGVAEFQVLATAERGRAVPPSTGKMYFTRGAFRMEWSTEVPNRGQRKPGEEVRPPLQLHVTMLTRASDPDRVTMINDGNRTYSVWDMKKVRDETLLREKNTFTVQKLGTDSVAGVSCQNARLTSPSGAEFETCLTRDLPYSSDWLSAFNRRFPPSIGWMKTLRESGLQGFPIRYVVKSKDTTVTMELTRFEKKALPASLFAIPAGYTEKPWRAPEG